MPTPPGRTQRTVLIIDDQPFFISMHEKLLNRQGYRVVSATSGAEGLNQAKLHKPDAIILDIMMPGMDGFAVCERLKQDETLKQIPVIILTATQDPKLNEKAFKVGAEITALKSMAGERLLNILQVMLQKGKPPG
jgi:CheY-like chemotaxis protein